MPSPLISPAALLWILAGITLVTLMVSRTLCLRRRRELAELARQWGMQYSPRDVFNLSARVAAHLPVTGAADVQISDLIYGTDSGGGHRCVFCAEYTAGIVRSKSRRCCVACVVELLHPGTSGDSTTALDAPPAPAGLKHAPSSLLQIAASDLSVLEQYRSLRPSTIAEPALTENNAGR